MYGTNIFYVSDDPHFSAKHFDETIKYQVKDNVPFDANWLAIEEDIKTKEGIENYTSSYTYSFGLNGIIPEFKLPGAIRNISIDQTYIGYELLPDGNYKINSNIINLNSSRPTPFNIVSTINYDWGDIKIEHLIEKHPATGALNTVIRVTKIQRNKLINLKRFSNVLVDYISKYSEYDFEVKYNIKPKIHSFDLPSWYDPGYSKLYNQIANVQCIDCTIKEIKNNTIIDYDFKDKASWININVSTGELSIDHSLIDDSSAINSNFQIELWTNNSHYVGVIDITYNPFIYVAEANVTFTNSTKLDNTVFIDGMGILKSTAMKMISKSSKMFEPSKIPLMQQLTESYKQVLDFDKIKDRIKYPVPSAYYSDSLAVKQTTLSFNQRLTGIVTNNFEFQTDNKVKHYKLNAPGVSITHSLNIPKIEVSVGYSTNTHQESIELNNKIAINHKVIYNNTAYDYKILNDELIFDNIQGQHQQFDESNTYLLFNSHTDLKFKSQPKGKSTKTPGLICHEVVYQHPMIKDKPTKTIPDDPNYTNGFKWDYIGFVHTGSGKYFTDSKQYGAIHDLSNWLFPLTWIYNRINTKYEGIDINNYVDDVTARDLSVDATVADFNFNEIPLDYYVKFREEFEERFMNNTYSQKADRTSNSNHINDRYGVNRQVVNQFYGWVWNVLWKYFNSNTSFHRFVDAIIKFGVPLIIEAYYMYDYEGDGFQRFHMYLISEISKEIKSKFIKRINGEKHHNRNIVIYNSYFRKSTLERNHDYFGRQFSRVTNIFTVKLYNELLIDQKRVTRAENDPAWLNYFNNFYDNYDFDILIPYKDNVIKYDEYYIDKREDDIPYKIYTRKYPKTRGVEFEWVLDKNAIVDALYMVEDNYSMRSDILHTAHKLIPVNYSHHDSIHVMQNKLWFDDYSRIVGPVERLSSVNSRYSITDVGYIMRNTLTVSDYLSIDTLPAHAEVFLNLESLGLTKTDDIDVSETFFNLEMNPIYKRYNRLNAIIHNIDELSNELDDYNIMLLKYLKRFMLIFDIRDGKIKNKEKMASILRKATNLFAERLVIYLNCYTEEDYLIGRIIAQRLSNLIKIDIAINIVDHVSQSAHTEEINFRYSNRPQNVADTNLIYIENSNGVHSIVSIYKNMVNDCMLFISGIIDSDITVNGSTTGWGDINLIELLSISNTYKNESELYIIGKVDPTLVNSLEINVTKL